MASSPTDPALTLALETQTRALLSELDKCLTAIDSKWEARVGAFKSIVADSTQHMDSISSVVCADLEAPLATVVAAAEGRLRHAEANTSTRIAEHESTTQVFELWRPRIDSGADHLHFSMVQVRAAVSTRDLRWPPDAHGGGSSHPGVFGSMRESGLACPEPLAVNAAAGAGTTTNAARVTDIRLDNPITTFLGPNINPDGAAAGGAAGQTVRAAAAGWSRVPHARSDPYEPDGAAPGRGRAGAATLAPGRHVRGLPQQAACHDQEGNYKIIAKAVNEVYRAVDPFGAVVARGNKEVASSHNLVQKEIDPSAHAAASTIRQAGRTAKYCSGNPSFRQRVSTDPWVSKNGARKLFDEMPTSAWRSPSRVLEVTIRQVYYPMRP
jgi:hypothetical protein